MKVKRIVSALSAIILATGMGAFDCFNASAASDVDSWSTSYLKNQPSNSSVTYTDSCVIYTYGNGYQSYCGSISGASDRYVKVYGDVASYNMTSKGYSSKKTISTSKSTVTFKFAAQSGTDGTIAKGSGTVGHYGKL